MKKLLLLALLIFTCSNPISDYLRGDCSDKDYCSNCDLCETDCCPNYCSGNYYYYDRSCSNGFCVGSTNEDCPNGCDSNGCIE